MEKIIRIDAQNIDSEHICCAIGNDKAHGSPFGTLGIYFNGLLKGHAPMTEKSFKKSLKFLE